MTCHYSNNLRVYASEQNSVHPSVNKPICYTTLCDIIVQSNIINGQELQQLSSLIPPNILRDKTQICDWTIDCTTANTDDYNVYIWHTIHVKIHQKQLSLVSTLVIFLWQYTVSYNNKRGLPFCSVRADISFSRRKGTTNFHHNPTHGKFVQFSIFGTRVCFQGTFQNDITFLLCPTSLLLLRQWKYALKIFWDPCSVECDNNKNMCITLILFTDIWYF